MEYVNVIEDESRMAIMLKHSQNDRRVPVIVDHGKVTIGFDGGS